MKFQRLSAGLLGLLTLAACGNNGPAGSTKTGGATSVGGQQSGGSSSSLGTGGLTSSGGTRAGGSTGGSGGAAGASAQGGSVGAGGSSGTGGVTGSGGATTGSGGTSASGGVGGRDAGMGGAGGRDASSDAPLGTGGVGAGGSTSSGGTPGVGGTPATGGGTGAGGTAATGGTPGAGGASTCTPGTGGSAANTLAVTVDSAQDLISDGIFGLLMERLGKNWSGGLFVGTSSSIPNTDGMRNDVIDAFKEAGVGMIEWPGGCAAGSYNWSSNKNPSNDVGTDRYMKLCGLLGIEPMIVGPATTAAAANNLAWVTYINNNSTHPDWALHHFKIGNEVWGCGGLTQGAAGETAYEPIYLANYDALSPPVNGKKLKIVAGTDLIGNWGWLDTMLKNIGSKIDGIELHDYIYHPSDIPNVGFSDAQYYNIVNAANKGQMGPRIDTAITYLDKYDPDKRIKIYEDEWGDWLEPFSSSDSWLQQGTVMDAISAAETLHLFMQHADRYQMAGLAQGINVIHSLLLTRSSDSALVKTPTFYVFKMFLPHHRSSAKWAPNTLKSENITGNGQTFPVLSAGTSVDDQGRVNISLANVDLVNTRTIDITLSSSKTGYTVASAQVVTGPAKDSYNDYVQTEKVNIQPLAASSYSMCGKSLRITLPAKSVVMFSLNPQ